jgi:hypothetical protein
MVDDPSYITHANWADLGNLLVFLWLLVVVVIGFAGSTLLAHGIIPSLAASGDLPDQRLLKLRPLLYAGAFILLVLVGVLMGLIIPQVDVLGDIYERWWV